jgi:biotin transport system substrate-specific component
MPPEQLRGLVLASLMAALTAVGSTLIIPFGPVPIVLTNLFVLLSGLLLGSRRGLISMGLYLLIGIAGMPVFAGGSGGMAHVLGPTGGYLFGYAAAAGITGFISERSRCRLLPEILAVTAGILAIYLMGVPWLKWVTRLSWSKALLIGVLPFVPGDAIKASIALMLARTLRPLLNRQSYSSSATGESREKDHR